MKRHFDSFIDAFLRYTEHVEAPEKFLRWSAISTLAGAMERKTWIVFNGTQFVYPNMYIMLIGPPGLAKKSSSSGLAMQLLQEMESLRFMSAQATSASLVDQMARSGVDREIEIEGVRYLNSSLFLYSSEAAVTLKEITGSGSLIELLTDFYDCAPSGWSKTRAWSKETVSRGRIKVFNPCLNILACSTPDWLVKSIGKDEVRGGFASRVLFVVQKDKPERSVGWIDDFEQDQELMVMKRKLSEDLQMVSMMCGRFKTELGFGAAFNALKKRTDQFLIDKPNDPSNGYYARKAWHALKLSQILSADESNDLLIKVKHFEKALFLLEELEPNMQAAFGAHGENLRAMSLNTMWELIRTKVRIEKKEILRLTWKDADGRTVDEHLRLLCDMQKLKPNLTGGRVVYEVVDGSPLV